MHSYIQLTCHFLIGRSFVCKHFRKRHLCEKVFNLVNFTLPVFEIKGDHHLMLIIASIGIFQNQYDAFISETVISSFIAHIYVYFSDDHRCTACSIR